VADLVVEADQIDTVGGGELSTTASLTWLQLELARTPSATLFAWSGATDVSTGQGTE
jgi:hypothetical protein